MIRYLLLQSASPSPEMSSGDIQGHYQLSGFSGFEFLRFGAQYATIALRATMSRNCVLSLDLVRSCGVKGRAKCRR